MYATATDVRQAGSNGAPPAQKRAEQDAHVCKSGACGSVLSMSEIMRNGDRCDEHAA